MNSEENYFLQSLGFQLNLFAALSHIGNLTVTPADGERVQKNIWPERVLALLPYFGGEQV